MTIYIQRGLKFIHSEKTNISNKESLSFGLLNIAQPLMSNYINIKTVKMKIFYKTVYCKSKNFYLKQAR